jgi:hypothetical protein
MATIKKYKPASPVPKPTAIEGSSPIACERRWFPTQRAMKTRPTVSFHLCPVR